jgi:hypothetical protein
MIATIAMVKTDAVNKEVPIAEMGISALITMKICATLISQNGKRKPLRIKIRTSPRRRTAKSGGGVHTTPYGAYTNHHNATRHLAIIILIITAIAKVPHPLRALTPQQGARKHHLPILNYVFKEQSPQSVRIPRNDGAAQDNALYLSIERNKRRKSTFLWHKLPYLHKLPGKQHKNNCHMIQIHIPLALITDALLAFHPVYQILLHRQYHVIITLLVLVITRPLV